MRIAFVWIVLLCATKLLSQTPISIDSDTERIILGKNYTYLTSTKDKYSFDQIRELLPDSFIECKSEMLFLNEQDYLDDIWLRIQLKQVRPTDNTYILEINNPLIDHVDYYHTRGGVLLEQNIAGDVHAFNKRSIQFRNPIYKLVLKDTSVHEIFIRLNADGRKMHLPMSIKSVESFIKDTSTKDQTFGFFFGTLALFTLLYFYLSFILHDKTFLFFAIYMFFLTISQLCTSGLAFEYLWPHATYWNNRSITVSMGLAIISALIFTKSFITHNYSNRKLDVLIYVFIGITCCITLLAFGNSDVLSFSMILLYRMIPVMYFLLIVLGLYYLINEVKFTRLFLFGFIIAFFITGIMIYHSMIGIPDNIFTNNLVLFAILFKCFFISIAMLDRLKIFKIEKEQLQSKMIENLQVINKYKEDINKVLEKKVEEKSKELLENQKEIKRALISGEEKERKRIAQELHDGMGSLLSTLKLNAESIGLNNKDLNPDEAQAYQNVLNMIDKACNELRTISHNMLPSSIELFGIKSTLESLIHKLNNNHSQTQFVLDTFGLDELKNKETELHIYRMVLELINNILKHAHAKNATIQIIHQHKNMTIIVEDDGVGMDVHSMKNHGLGFISLKSRVDALSGNIVIDSHPNNGTTVVIELPYLN